MPPRPDYIIGIDPDCDKSGVAVYKSADRRLTLYTLPYHELTLLLERYREQETLVIVEDVVTSRANWHLSPQDSKRTAAAKGYGIGRCAQVGHHLLELLHYWHMPHILQTPLAKYWRGRDRKITAPEFRAVLQSQRITLTSGAVTNQEQRDAALLAIFHLGIPITRLAKDIRQ